MNFFKKRAIWSNWELGLLKVTMILPGLLLGLYFHDSLDSLSGIFLTLFIMLGILSTALWVGKMK